RHQQREGAARQRVLAEALRPGEERDQPEREQVAADDEALGHEGREVVEPSHVTSPLTPTLSPEGERGWRGWPGPRAGGPPGVGCCGAPSGSAGRARPSPSFLVV